MEVIHSIKHNGMSIEVVETQQTIYLQFDGGLKQSTFKKKNPKDLQSRYCKEMVKVLEHVPNPKDILVLGLGGGVIPTYLYNYTNANIDVVEIVPDMKEIAEKYFGMPITDRLNIIIDDAKDYISSCNKKYDLVFVDIFGAISSVIDDDNEFHRALKSILKDTGFVILNLLVTKRNYEAHMEVLNSNYSNVIEGYVKLGRYSNNHISYCSKER